VVKCHTSPVLQPEMSRYPVPIVWVGSKAGKTRYPVPILWVGSKAGKTRYPVPIVWVGSKAEKTRYPLYGWAPRQKRPVTQYPLYGWAPRQVWTGKEYLASVRIQILDRPAFTESLYRMVKVKVSLSTLRKQIVALEVRLHSPLTSAMVGSGKFKQ
jgi:hypothetical protein